MTSFTSRPAWLDAILVANPMERLPSMTLKYAADSTVSPHRPRRISETRHLLFLPDSLGLCHKERGDFGNGADYRHIFNSGG